MSDVVPTPARRVAIFDTTLRDGEQSPGVALGIPQKLEIAHSLARLGVDVIEAGFPIASPGDFECVSRIAREVRGPTICALARTHRADIERAGQALEGAARGRIHVFTSASTVHLTHMLRQTPEQVIESAVAMVRLARELADDVEFSGQDVMRADPQFVFALYGAAVEAGATTINIPDTVGYGTPLEYGGLIRRVIERVVGDRQVVVSAHCHDDLGLAVANSLAAVEHGASQVECTVNGIGERAGNTALEEVVMALHTRRDHFGVHTGINTRELYRVSRLVSRLSGMPVQPNKAVVGDHAFAHEAGIHQDGVLKHRETYEIMNAELVGREAAVLVMGKHSGRAAFRKALSDLGYALDDAAVNALFARFKEMADRKGAIGTEDLRALVETREQVPAVYRLESLQVVSGTHLTPMATVRLVTPDGVRQEAATGDGPVDAAYRAINRITGLEPVLESYRLEALTSGGDAVGEVSLRAHVGGVTHLGRGVATDIVEASARAWLEVVNAAVARAPGRREAAGTV